MPTVALHGMRLHYRDDGAGECLVLLHSLGGSGSMWLETMPYWRERYRIIAPDFRGHGQSEQGVPAEIDPCAGDVLALLDRLGIRRASLVGLSMGGQVAMRLAIEAPARVDAMVLANTSAGAAGAGAARFDQARARIVEAGPEAFARDYVASRLAPGTAGSAVERYVANVVQTLPMVYLQTLQSILAQDVRPLLAAVTAPTLVITGDCDISTPLPAARELHQAIAGSALAVLDGAGHFSVLDRPQVFARLVSDFLKRSTGSPR